VKLGPLPDAVKPGFHCARTHWIRGFMAFGRVRDARIVMLMVPM
jgi:predicted DNA-binding protein (MmcQ/YjbR family)